MSTRILVLAVALMLSAPPAQARLHQQRSCAPLWVNDGKCRSPEWTCRRFHVDPAFCDQTTFHARFGWCVLLSITGKTATWSKCDPAGEWHGRGGVPTKTG